MREWDAASLMQLVLLPCVPYLLWAVLYYIKVPRMTRKKCFFPYPICLIRPCGYKPSPDCDNPSSSLCTLMKACIHMLRVLACRCSS